MILRRELTQREWSLCVAAALVVVVVPLFRYLLAPAYRDWNASRMKLQSHTIEHSRLVRNLARKQIVDQEFARLDGQAYQTESDPMILATWLRQLEVLARLPGMSLDNMKALPVKQERAYKVYRVRLSVSGKFPEVLRFMSDSTNGQAVTGLESFVLRGIQGPSAVECTVTLKMIRLTGERPGSAAQPAAGKGETEAADAR